MTALDKKINQLAARHRWNVTPVHDRFIPCYSIVPMDRQERDRIKATLDRCKGLKVKVEQVFSPYAWTCTIYVFDLAEWNAQQERSRLEWSIVNAYSEAYHFNGHDSAGAKLADTAQAGQIGQVVTVGGAVLPGADRGGGGADRGGPWAEEKPGRAALAVRSGFFVSAADRGGAGPSRC